MRKDYKYMPLKASNREDGLWIVYVGSEKEPLIQTTCKSEAIAKATADCLNYDPNWFARRSRVDFRKQQGVNI